MHLASKITKNRFIDLYLLAKYDKGEYDTIWAIRYDVENTWQSTKDPVEFERSLVIVRKIDPHPKFNSNGGVDYDMTVLTLDKKVKIGPGAFPICLPPAKSYVYDQVRLP